MNDVNNSLQDQVPEGYMHTEVGVIPCAWDVEVVGNLCSITTGSKNTQDRISEGLYPFFVRSQTVERINSYSFDGEAVLTAGDGVGTGKIFHYINGKFDVHQRVYKMSGFRKDLSGFYFYKYFSSRFYDRIMSMTAKSSVDSVRREMIAGMAIALPPKKEQTAIANALCDIDTLITSLEKLITKKRAIKTAAMQQLLTGKKRLPPFNQSHTGYKQTELGEIPKDWDVKSIGALFKVTAGGDLRKNEFSIEQTNDHFFPIYSNALANMGLYGFCLTFDYEGDFVTVTARGGIGHADVRAGCFCAIGRLLVLEPIEDLSCKFVSEYINQYLSFANESTGVPQLTAPQILQYNLVIPSNDEQIAIANVLADIDIEVESLERRLLKVRQMKQGMMQELLTGRTRLIVN